MSEEKMYGVKIIIMRCSSTPNYVIDDYTDFNRAIVEDYSGFDEVTNEELYDIEQFVEDYNLSDINKGEGRTAHLIVKDETISPKQAIKYIVEKRKKLIKEEKERQRKIKEEAEIAKRKRELNKHSKTMEQKKKLLEQLKNELGETT